MSADPPRPPTRILAADDNDQNRELVRATLESEGLLVELAADGEEAVEAFTRSPADCVLLDVRMPRMDGLEACRRIRGLPGGEGVPIVFLTALREVDAFDSALAAGGDDFLTKPVRPTELIARVQTALKLSRLGHELREHVELVRRQRDEMMRVQLQNERLAAFVVHDLKNPVNSIDLQAQLLVRRADQPERAREAAAQIRSEARNLLRLILNLLDISKSEEGGLVPRLAELSFTELTEEVLSAMEVKARAHKVRLASELRLEPPALRADPDLLRRVLENLVDNAIRHTPEGGTVTVSAARAEEEIEIRVSDTGRGIPPELRERIFEKYVQVESGTQGVSRSGRGLGLAFCRVAVEAHGGRIRVVDAASEGTVMCVRLPDAR